MLTRGIRANMSFLDDMKKLSAETEQAAQREREMQQHATLECISRQCENILHELPQDIQNDASGEGSLKGSVLGFLIYPVEDENKRKLRLTTREFGIENIKLTNGFQSLAKFCQNNGLKLELKEDREYKRTPRDLDPIGIGGIDLISFNIIVRGWKKP